MDDDLGVGKAFDAVYAQLGEIIRLLDGEVIHESLSNAIKQELQHIDEVFGVIF